LITADAITGQCFTGRQFGDALGLYSELYNQKDVLNIWSEHNYIFSHRIVHITTCFGPVYWSSSGFIINLISGYTICPWGTHAHIV